MAPNLIKRHERAVLRRRRQMEDQCSMALDLCRQVVQWRLKKFGGACHQPMGVLPLSPSMVWRSHLSPSMVIKVRHPCDPGERMTMRMGRTMGLNPQPPNHTSANEPCPRSSCLNPAIPPEPRVRLPSLVGLFHRRMEARITVMGMCQISLGCRWA